MYIFPKWRVCGPDMDKRPTVLLTGTKQSIHMLAVARTQNSSDPPICLGSCCRVPDQQSRHIKPSTSTHKITETPTTLLFISSDIVSCISRTALMCQSSPAPFFELCCSHHRFKSSRDQHMQSSFTVQHLWSEESEILSCRTASLLGCSC